jgi:hypothetical protein
MSSDENRNDAGPAPSTGIEVANYNIYFYIVFLLMLLLPMFSVLVERFAGQAHTGMLYLLGKWFVFWSVGVRLFLAGLRQSAQPRFTAEAIFGLGEDAPLQIIRELGYANIAIGLLGFLSITNKDWCVPAAVTGAVFYGLSGLKHLKADHRNRLQNVAMISDLFVFSMLAIFLTANMAMKAMSAQA